MLPREAVSEFAQLYKARYQIELTLEEAELKANKFYNLMKILILNSDPNLVSNAGSIQDTGIELANPGGKRKRKANRKFNS